MNENNDFETIEVPDILLELNGLRTASMSVNAATIIEAENLLQSGRFVEAGVGDWLKNLIFKGRFKPEEVDALIARLKNLGVSSLASAEQKENHKQMISFLEHLNEETRGGIKKPFQKGMSDYWRNVDELATGAENAAKNATGFEDASLDTLQQAMGNVGTGIEHGFDRGFVGINRAWNFFSRNDKELLSANMPGVYQIGSNGTKNQITYKKFFEDGYLNAGGGSSPGNIFMSSPDAVKTSLDGLSKNIGSSAKLRGWLNVIGQSAAIATKAVPVAVAGGTLWAFNQGAKNHAPSASELNEVSNSDYLSPKRWENSPGQTPSGGTSNPSGGLGGTTNGNNIGGLGGQYSPNKNESWAPPKPNLKDNSNDWLPTNTSDYYNLVDRKSDVDLNNQRLAQAFDIPNIESPEEAVRNILTILEQGAPGNETLNRARQYVEHLNNKVQPILREFYQRLESDKTDNHAQEIKA